MKCGGRQVRRDGERGSREVERAPGGPRQRGRHWQRGWGGERSEGMVTKDDCLLGAAPRRTPTPSSRMGKGERERAGFLSSLSAHHFRTPFSPHTHTLRVPPPAPVPPPFLFSRHFPSSLLYHTPLTPLPPFSVFPVILQVCLFSSTLFGPAIGRTTLIY